MKWIRVPVMAGAVLLSFASSGVAQQTVFVVRHAERAPVTAAEPSAKNMMAEDPPLSAAGQARAAKLAALLASADVEHIFTTEFRRTRETAAPLAAKLKLQPVMAAARDPDPLIERVRQVTGNVLIVGHSNTVPDLLKKLGVKQPVTIGDDEYDSLFIVVRPTTGEPTLVRLKY
jgi:phosphohistidine phosphatase SixA